MIHNGREGFVQNVYQMMAFLGSEQSGIDDKQFTQAVWLIYEWVKQNAAGSIWLPELPGTVSGSDAKSGKAVAAIYEPEGNFFTLRLSTAKPNGTRDITEVEIRPYLQKLAVAIRMTKFSSLELGSHKDISFELPSFLPSVMKEVGLNDGAAITTKPWYITASAMGSFVDFICLGERNLPIVAVSQAKNPCIGFNGYACDLQQCATALSGVAHVAAISWDATFALSSAVGNEWSCFNGAIRIYWPGGIDFDADDPYQNPLYTIRNIDRIAFGSSFVDYLKLSIWRYNRSRSVDWAACEIDFYIEAEQIRLSSASEQESPDAIIKRYREQIDRIRESLEEYRTLAEGYFADLVEYRDDSDGMHRQMTALTKKVNQQRMEIARLKHGEAEKVPVDLGYEELPSWVERYYPDSLFLHPRAIRALKDAVYQNPSMVYRCLSLLAVEYRAYRIGTLSREEFLKKCNLVDPGLAECGCGESSNIGEQGGEYYVRYGGRRCLLERHLKKGVSHNPLYCLRIYFFWDEKNSIVVIGSLPGHLHSSDT